MNGNGNKNKNKKYIQQSNDAWRELSAWWDEEIQDGDPFHQLLIFPGVMELVDCQPGMKILDMACGNGALSRRFAALGAAVLGVDVSETFIKQAKARSKDNIRYQVLDATSEAQLSELANGESFDVIVCSMALHDLPVISPLVDVLPLLLKKNGRFVFSIPHPCFNMGELKLEFFADEPYLSRSRYVNSVHLEMKSKPGQPINQHCFHRSMATLFDHFFSIGMVLDDLKEPSISSVKEDLSQVDLAWKLLPEIPPAMICRWIFKQ